MTFDFPIHHIIHRTLFDGDRNKTNHNCNNILKMRFIYNRGVFLLPGLAMDFFHKVRLYLEKLTYFENYSFYTNVQNTKSERFD